MNLRIRSITFALLVANVALPAMAQSRMLPAERGDLVASRLITPARTTALPDVFVDRAPARLSWALEPGAAIDQQRPFVQESREYSVQVEGEQLRTGAAFRVDAPHAVIRLSPQGSTRGIDPLRVELVSQGQRIAADAAFSQLAGTAELNRTGATFAEGTVAFKLASRLGVGEFVLVAPDADGRYLLHVYEPESGERLSLSTDRDTLLHGDSLRVITDYTSAAGRQLGAVEGELIAPNGQTTPLRFEDQPNARATARVAPDVAAGAGPGLWQVRVRATSADREVIRHATTAFAAAVPTAGLSGSVAVVASRQSELLVRVGIDVRHASRYGLSGVLFGSVSRGPMVPVAATQSAAWLDAGAQQLELAIDPSILRASGAGAPYELRQLVLVDQASMGMQERRERALRFSP
jgi:hypothetical protein